MSSFILTSEEIEQYTELLDKLPPKAAERSKIMQLFKLHKQAICRDRFLPYVKTMWPGFIAGRHHKIMADAFERVASGDLKRLIINMAPRHTKSEFASYLLPSWFLGKYPEKKIIQTAHTAELAVGFGRKVRNLVNSEDYLGVFQTKLSSDSKAAGRWNTSEGGEYFAIGVGGAVTGKGADLLIIDDPHALEINTPVATPNGFVALADLKVGDEVFGPDGEPTKVIGKSPVYRGRELYEVKTFDGQIILADAKHLWNVRTSTRVKDRYRNLTTESLVNSRSSGFMIPRHYAVQYPYRELPVDPWVLGAWLGDGTSSLGRMTAHPDDAIFMRGEFRRRGYETTDLADKFSFGVNGLMVKLRDLGVLDNKHIPEQYMTASYLQRMDLLRGLMDTDGNVTKEGQCAFHNKDARLVDQVVELLHSLGRKCRRRTYECKGKFGTCLMHRVTFKLKDCALMPRKRARTRTTHDKQHRSITVRKTGKKGDVQCITVGRPDGLFLAGRGYVVTHNSEQEATQAASDPTIYDKVYEWYTSGPRQRLQPGGAIVIVMCMTGDTPVLMADGTEKELKDIRPGDAVATYENGSITTSRINNWRSSGFDSIYTVQTQSGRILRANERHPFLVDIEGVRQWIRLKNLKPGMELVSTMAVTDHQKQKQNPGFVTHASLALLTIKKILTRPIGHWATTANGGALSALNLDAIIQPTAGGYVKPTTESNIGHQVAAGSLRKPKGLTGLNLGMESPLINMIAWLWKEITGAMSAASFLPSKTPERIGMASSASTIATIRGWLEGFYATTAILRLDTEKTLKSSERPLHTCKITLDKITNISRTGFEEVFDVEVDRTENFIANGFVSHNTRWGKRDLTGQILNRAAARDSDEWEVIELPAIMPSGNPLWPEYWSKEELEAVKNELTVAKWNAQYMQNPTSEEGAIIKREMWRIWREDRAPQCKYLIQSWDTAFEKSNRADYSACTTWGVFDTVNEDGKDIANIMLLDAFKDRMEFPTLKRTVYQMWKEWNPDTLLIEKKAAGAPLVYEMRKMGIPISEYTPTRGSDKIARVNAISDMFASGLVWCPDRRWAEEVMEELAAFPNGDHDDLVDSTSQALLRFRQGGFIAAPTDEQETVYPRRKVRYY